MVRAGDEDQRENSVSRRSESEVSSRELQVSSDSFVVGREDSQSLAAATYQRLLMTQKQNTVCAVFVVIYRVCKLVRSPSLMVTRYKLQINPIIKPNPVSIL